jgi:hypothetical protein
MSAASQGLDRTRAELRRSLVGRRAAHRGQSAFPRSAIMRALLQPDLRLLWVGGLTVLTVVAGRRMPIARLYPWLNAYSAIRHAVFARSGSEHEARVHPAD